MAHAYQCHSCITQTMGNVSKAGTRPKVLFVDDEATLRMTIPEILGNAGFEVVAAGTVPEALGLITTQKFDLLLSDLNIGELSDGFTVVSAMRRLQPDCRTLILTGFPDFDTALEQIRNHADGYVLKPTRPEALVDRLRQQLTAPSGSSVSPRVQLSRLMKDSITLLQQRWLRSIKSDPDFEGFNVSDAELVDHIPALLMEVAAALDAGRDKVQRRSQMGDEARATAREHGRSRMRLGYTLRLLFKEARFLQCQIFDLAQENLLSLDLSTLLPELTVVTDTIEVLVAESVQVFASEGGAMQDRHFEPAPSKL